MTPQDAIDLGQQSIATMMLVGGPILLVGLVMGLAIGLIQALTQIQDQTVSFVPKIIAMVLAASLCLPWLIQMMMDYTKDVIVNIPAVIVGG